MEKESMRALVREYRRDFHRYPEEGWLTFRTSILAAEELEKAGYTVYIGEEIVPASRVIDPPEEEQARAARERCRRELESSASTERRMTDLSGGVEYDDKEQAADLWDKWEARMGSLGGVVAIYDSGMPGPTLACRFDMDALQITESGAKERLPVREDFVSRHDGCFHGCGHDGHTAAGLVTALRLAEERDSLCGKLIMIFQPAEEGVRGAKSYCANWRFGAVDIFLSGHIGFTESVTFVAGADQFLATSEIDGEFIGRSAHAAAAPERGRNALAALAEAIVRMQEIPKPEEGTVRLNVGVVRAGEARNTIPAHACFQMETRGSSDVLSLYMREEAEKIIDACAKKYDVECRLRVRDGGDCGDSSEELSRRILRIAEETGLYERCTLHQMFGASDDATTFMRMVQESGGQAAYMLFGCPVNGRHHESGFDFDEEVLEKSCEIWFRVILDLMK